MQNNKTHISIISPSDENYVQHLAVMIASVLHNSTDKEEFDFYVMDGGISDKSKKKLLKLKKIKDFNINYVTGSKDKYKFCPLPQKHVENTYYRFEIPAFLPNLSRVLLLDPDIVVRKSLKEFWQTDLEDFAVAAVENPLSSAYPKRLKYAKTFGYFNAGIVLMDLDKLRAMDFENKCFDIAKNNPEITWHVDQCFINSVLHNQWKRLPYKYNFMSIMPFESYKEEYYGLKITPDSEVIEAMNDTLIVHFIGDNKPWEFMSNRLYKSEYWKYLRITPWRNYIPKDFTILNLFKKYILFNERFLNTIRKIFGKKPYLFIESKKNKQFNKEKEQKEYDKFKRENPNLDNFCISLEDGFDGYNYLNDLDFFDEKSWNKWFMTNSILEVVCSFSFYNNLSGEKKELINDLVYNYLKYNGKFKIINLQNNEKSILIHKL